MRGQEHCGTNAGAAPSTPMQYFDLETFYRRLSRRNDCLERQVNFESNKFSELLADLTRIAQDYKDTDSEREFGLSDSSSSC
ncbi:hypothetical protein MKX03_001826 [Papaver bracteatum]|nr:hypothetical protein MKX03_001826 [Papaver bracteatum]